MEKINIDILVEDLNRILNDVVRENRELKHIIQQIHSLGFNVQISFNMGESGTDAIAKTESSGEKSKKINLKLSKDDYLFLKSIKIAVDE